jgi:pyridoxamine 5'-phosphate oxidase
MAHDDPIAEFRDAFAQAKQRVEPPYDPTACALATADAAGRPSVRVVLLKHVDERGFVFYTNYASRKADQLAENPWAALVFHWAPTARQVRAEGRCEKVPPEESDAYFASRDHGSRIGAWASKQSQPLPSRAHLVARVAKAEVRFAGRAVPRPEFWGGYRLVPERMEFWWNQLHRLHDRLLYTRDGDGWTVQRLYP